MGDFGGQQSTSGEKVAVNLPPPTEEEVSVTRALVEAVAEQAELIQRAADEQRALFDRFPVLFEEAEAAVRATGEFDTAPLSERERDLLDRIAEESQRIGEADIARFADERLENIRDVLAPGRGLRPGDSPILAEAADVAREAQIQQGQLTRSVQAARAGAEFDRLFQRDELRARLQQLAFENRLGLATSAANIGLNLNPQVDLAAVLDVLQRPRIASAAKSSVAFSSSIGARISPSVQTRVRGSAGSGGIVIGAGRTSPGLP